MAIYRRCSMCIYFDICDHTGVCNHYHPMEETAEYDAAVEKLIESGRDEYRQAWRSYISEYNDDLFF